MIFKIALFLILTLATLMACSKQNDDNIESEPVTIISKKSGRISLNLEAFRLVNVKFPICDEGELTEESKSLNYEIEPKKLTLTDGQGCPQMVFSGNSDSLNGVWTWESSKAIVPEKADKNCEDELEQLPDGDYSRILTITDSTVLVEDREEVCFAELLSQENQAIKAIDCNSWTMTEGGKVGTFKLLSRVIEGNEIAWEFRYKGKSCKVETLPDVAPSEDVCTNAWKRYLNEDDSSVEWDNTKFTENPENAQLMDDFRSCILETGFSGLQGSSALSSVLRTITNPIGK